MKTYRISILNPKAIKLLQGLADLDLISFKPQDDGLGDVVARLRKKASANKPSLEEISEEVEKVRAKRHAAKKG